MAENVQLQKVMVNGMIIKVGRYDICCHIVCRMLHRGKLIDAVSVRQYDDPSRMLARTSANPCASHRNSVNLTLSFSVPAFLVIVPYITKSGLICKCSDSPGLKRMAFPE